jgi:hypothetical protein
MRYRNEHNHVSTQEALPDREANAPDQKRELTIAVNKV